MVYSYTSCEIVITQLIRRTKMTDTTYADDILEWIREAMGLMRTRGSLVPCSIDLQAIDNTVELPCGVVFIDGVFYNGKRLRHGTGVVPDKRMKKWSSFNTTIDSYFATDVNSDGWTKNEQSYLLARGADLKQITEYETEAFYIPYANHFQTSFKEGCLSLFYRSMPVDNRGYPMIPDEENTRTALFWYLMSMLAIGGYKFPDARMDFDYCDKQFDKYKKISKNKIGYWSTDKKEAFLNYWVNLMPPTNYYDNFSISGEQPKSVTL